ncbi:class I adenylate-forming enzyme family protein [Marinobacter sp.]|uniref:class I adenylate-forming enzyme family protein n=1 Tax=Marinobacter sp. TaxID=50741 RepID=UPI003A8D0682
MNTQTYIPQLGRISDYPAHYAEKAPNRIALSSPSAELTYKELNDQVTAHARALWSTGVRPGDRVAFMGSPRVEFVISFLATASIGAIWLGLNPRYSARELEYVLSDASPNLVFSAAGEEETENLHKAMANTELNQSVAARSFEDFETFNLAGESANENDIQAARDAVNSQDPALIVYTSGSTGAPKGALIRHSGLVRLGLVEGSVWDLSEPVMLCNLPINHIGCVGDLVSVPIVIGAKLLLRESFDAEAVLRDVQEHKVSALFQIPTQLQRMSALPEFTQFNLSSLQVVAWGGAPLPPESLRRYRALGVKLISTYGLTEATSSVSYTPHNASDEVLANTVGTPDEGMRVQLLSDGGVWLDSGEGEVCVKNDTVMAGYLNRQEQTKEAFTDDGWLRTGDIGYIRDDGNLVLVGRMKDVFKSGGYNIYPREIEKVIEEHPDVQLSAVIARPDPDFHEVGVVFIQVAPASSTTPDQLREWCRDKLANFKIPKEFLFLDSLPLLPVGKVDKNTLKQKYSSEKQ